MGKESARTSLNQVPALHKQFANKASHTTVNVIDFGCGRYNKGKEFLECLGFKVHNFDPYNQPEETNERTLVKLISGAYDAILLANVLNVCDNDERDAIYHDISRHKDKLIFISIYEGNKTGQRKETKTGTIQNNMKAKDYLKELTSRFELVKIKGNTIQLKVK